MQIYATTHLEKEYKKLIKVRKHYFCLSKRLFEYLYKSSLMPSGDLLHKSRNGEVSVFKARMKSCTKNGKSYGFRMVYLKHPQFIILLEIYPKWGPKGATDIKPEGVEFLLAEALGEKENNELLSISQVEQKGKLEFSEQNEIISDEVKHDEEE